MVIDTYSVPRYYT